MQNIFFILIYIIMYILILGIKGSGNVLVYFFCIYFVLLLRKNLFWLVRFIFFKFIENFRSIFFLFLILCFTFLLNNINSSFIFSLFSTYFIIYIRIYDIDTMYLIFNIWRDWMFWRLHVWIITWLYLIPLDRDLGLPFPRYSINAGARISL